MSATVPAEDMIDSVSNPRNPFGLPLGTVRGFLSLLICGFFWVVMLWPNDKAPETLLAHYFMLTLVLLTFSPYTKGAMADDGSNRFLPRLLRLVVVLGSLAVVGLALVKDPTLLKQRLTPETGEVQEWWVPFLATTAAGYAGGLILRVLLGRDNPVFQTLRAWFSLIGMLMLIAEIVFWIVIAGAEKKPDIHIWQAFDLALIAAYFGTRA